MILEKHYKYIFLIVLFMTYIAYSNSFFSPPVLDDYHSFIDEPLIKQKTLSIDNILALSESKFGLTRWIPMLSFYIDLNLGKGSVFNLHLTNFIIHTITSLSVFIMLFRMTTHVSLRGMTKESLPSSGALALWVAALWTLNPVQTNAVTYLVQRMASLSALFSVLCIALYFMGRSRSIAKEKLLSVETLPYFVGSLLCMMMGLLCKENALILPVLLFLTEIWFFQPDLHLRIAGFILQRRWLLVTGVLGVILGVAYFLPGIVSSYGGRHFTLSQRLLTEGRIVIWYITLLLWPNPSRMSLEHDVPLSTSLFSPISTLFSFALLAGLVSFAVIRRKSYPLTTYGIIWFFLNLAIESSIIPLELIFEHRLYLPSVGLMLSITVAAYTIFHHFGSKVSGREFATLSWCIMALLCSALTLATFARNASWSDYVSLNRDNVLKAPNNPRAHCNLAVALSKDGEFTEAIREAETSIKLGKSYYESYCEASNTIIISLLGLGKYEQAVQEGGRLIQELPPDSKPSALPNMHMNLALAHNELGNLRAAYAAITQGLETNLHLVPRQPSVAEMGIQLLHVLLAHNSSLQSDIDGDGSPDPGSTPKDTWIAQRLLHANYRAEALTLFQKSLAQNPQDPETRTSWNTLIIEQEQNYRQAQRWSFGQKYVRRPFSVFNICMATAYLVREKQLPSQLLKMGESLLDYALSIQPESADAQLLKGWYLYQRDESSEAIVKAKRAIELEPDSARAWLGLGFFLVKANHPNEAIEAFARTLELYPGYPQRTAILDISANLRRQQSPEQLATPHSDIEKSVQPAHSSSPPAST